jgi:hypothetical protein
MSMLTDNQQGTKVWSGLEHRPMALKAVQKLVIIVLVGPMVPMLVVVRLDTGPKMIVIGPELSRMRIVIFIRAFTAFSYNLHLISLPS